MTHPVLLQKVTLHMNVLISVHDIFIQLTQFNRPERNYDSGMEKSDAGLSLFRQSEKILGLQNNMILKQMN